VRLAGTLYSIYDKKTYKDRIWTMLDELEGRARPPAEDGPAFAPRMAAAE
jgi:hypothetical protein